MSLTASARSIPGTLRQEVLMAGRHRLVTDEPARIGGDDLGPAPHELLPAALAACISTTLVRYARRFDVRVRLTGDLTDEQLTRLERVACACPVRRSIEAGMVFAERLACEPAEVAA
jgi:putative redox protein